MSAKDDIFPDKPPVVRRPRPAAAPSADYDDPAVKARARALHVASLARDAASPPLADCTGPMRCQVGDHAHALVIGKVGERRPDEGERRYAFQREWVWNDAGQAWRCEAVHARGESAA